MVAESVSVPTLTEKLPRVNSEVLSNGVGKEKRRVVWEALPAGAKVSEERIARYRDHPIYRVNYEWDEDGSHCRGLVLAFHENWKQGELTVQPFFIVCDEALTGVSVCVVSTAERPFMIESRIGHQGNGVGWETYTHVFDASGAMLFEHKSGARRTKTRTDRYKGTIIQSSSRSQS